MIVALLFRLTDVRYRSYEFICKFISACGVPMNVMTLKNIKRRAVDPEKVLNCLSSLSSADLAFARNVLSCAPLKSFLSALTTGPAADQIAAAPEFKDQAA